MANKHGAVLVVGGKVLSVGVNTARNDVAPHIEHIHVSDHAEANAIRGIPLEALSKTTLYVVRINAQGKPMYSMPCIYCKRLISGANIKAVIHT